MSFSNDFQYIFDRAARQSLNLRSLLMAFIVLAASGLLVIFCRCVAMHAGPLVGLGLAFMPFFLSAALVLASGILFVRVYHDAVKKKAHSYRNVLARSWPMMMESSYFSVPIILSYLLLWMLLGLFYLLNEIPYLGEFFGVVLVFAPFILNMLSLLLCVVNLAVLFFVTPILALAGRNRQHLFQILSRRFKSDLFFHLLFFFVGLVPLAITVALLHWALYLTGVEGFVYRTSLQCQMQWFFLMIPYCAFLAPATVFFFNFATEAHVYMQNRLRPTR